MFAWTQRVSNRVKTDTHGFWGLGDALRGILSLYQYCKLRRYEFIVDTHRHPFSYFLNADTSPHHRVAAGSVVPFEGGDGDRFESIKAVAEPGETRLVFCNAFPQEPLLSDEKRLIQTLLSVKPEYRLALPPTPYTVLHIRAGDHGIDGEVSAASLNKYLALVNKHLQDGDVLCSDSAHLKHYVAAQRPTIRMYDKARRSGHVGYDTDPELLRNTLDDLQVIMGAARVFTYSNYSWISGFVQWGTMCLDIPLIDLKEA